MQIPMLFRFSLYGFLKNQRYYDPFLILAFLINITANQLGEPASLEKFGAMQWAFPAFRLLHRSIYQPPHSELAKSLRGAIMLH